jgi:hypothetical protein
MTHINIGDRVEYLGNTNKIKKGYKGIVVGLYGNDEETVLNVDWDNYTDGHSCEGLARQGHGWNVYARHVKLLKSSVELNPADAKYAHIIRKSKQLNERFVNRKKGTEYAF